MYADNYAKSQSRLIRSKVSKSIPDMYKIVFCVVSFLAIVVFFAPISFNCSYIECSFSENGNYSYNEVFQDKVFTVLWIIQIMVAVIAILKNQGYLAVIPLVITEIFILGLFLMNFARFYEYEDQYSRLIFEYCSASYLGLIEPCLLIAGIITAFLGEKNKTYEKGIMRKVRTTISYADELKKYKELLDSGAISEAEYMEKKKQILNQ